jgi:hypothetical protein
MPRVRVKIDLRAVDVSTHLQNVARESREG